MYGWRVIGVLGVLAISTMVRAQETATIKVDVKAESTVDDFAGVWSGAWDGTWKVRLTVKPMNNGQRAFILYEWVESIGKPMQRQGAVAGVQGHVLKHPFIDITRNPDDATKGKAVGNFRKPRTAELTRSELPADFMNAATALKQNVAFEKALDQLKLGDAMLYFATHHNFLMYAEKDVRPEDLVKLNDVRISIPQQADVILEDALRPAFDAAGLKYRVDGRDLRIGFKPAAQ